MTQAFQSPARLRFGAFELDAADARLLRDGRPVPLTPKAFSVLHLLAGRSGRLVTKDELLSNVWPDVVVSDASVKVCIGEIRKALDDDSQRPTYIETAHRRGYRFIADVSEAKGEIARPARQPASVATAPPPPPQTPLFARDVPLALLQDAFERAVKGERQAIFLVAAAGFGKTAVVNALLDDLPQPATVLTGNCFAQFGGSEPYLPLWEAVAQLLRSRRIPLLESLLARRQAAQSAASPRAESTGVTDRLLCDIADAIEAVTFEAPVVLVLEDLHWADYSTLDLVSMLARRPTPARLLIVASYRPPETEHPLSEVIKSLKAARRCVEYELPPLDEYAVYAFLQWRFGSNELAKTLARGLYKRTGGHPLFLAQLVNDLVDRRMVVEDDGLWRLVVGESEVASVPAAEKQELAWQTTLETRIPRTIREVIEAELTQLSNAEREILDAAAVAGVEFSAAAVAAGMGGDLVSIERTCQHLARKRRFIQSAGMTEWADGSLSSQFQFTHELYQNVVYEQIPAATRVKLHLSLGVKLAQAQINHAAASSATLAQHFEQGREWKRAAHYLRQAASAATRQYAHREAVLYLRRALAAMDKLPAEKDRTEELQVLSVLCVNLQILRGCASPEVEQLHARAYQLVQTELTRGGSTNVREIFPVLWGIWMFHKVRSNLSTALKLAEDLRVMAEQAPDEGLLLQTHQAHAMTYLCLGHFAMTRRHMDAAMAIYDPSRHSGNTERFAQDPGVATLAFGAIACQLLGDGPAAVAASQRAIEIARQFAQPSTLALAMHFAGMLHQLQGDAPAAAQWAQKTIDLSAREGFRFWHAGSTIVRGWSWTAQGRDDGVPEIRRGLDAWTATGSRTYLPYFLGLLGDALLRTDRTPEAQKVIDEAIASSQELEEGLYSADLNRLKLAATQPSRANA